MSSYIIHIDHHHFFAVVINDCRLDRSAVQFCRLSVYYFIHRSRLACADYAYEASERWWAATMAKNSQTTLLSVNWVEWFYSSHARAWPGLRRSQHVVLARLTKVTRKRIHLLLSGSRTIQSTSREFVKSSTTVREREEHNQMIDWLNEFVEPSTGTGRVVSLFNVWAPDHGTASSGCFVIM